MSSSYFRDDFGPIRAAANSDTTATERAMNVLRQVRKLHDPDDPETVESGAVTHEEAIQLLGESGRYSLLPGKGIGSDQPLVRTGGQVFHVPPTKGERRQQ